MLGNLIPPSDTKVNSSLSHKSRDISGGEEYQCEREVLDEGNVEPRVAVKLDIGAMEEV